MISTGDKKMTGKPLPTKLKVLRGTARKNRINKDEPDPTPEIPEAPEHLSDEALKEWHRITKELDKVGLISQLDRTELAMYCQAYGRWVKYEKIVAETGELYESEKGGLQQSPAMWVVNRAMEQCHKFLSEFGMTPSSRSKVSATKKKVSTVDEWDKLLKMG